MASVTGIDMYVGDGGMPLTKWYVVVRLEFLVVLTLCL